MIIPSSFDVKELLKAVSQRCANSESTAFAIKELKAILQKYNKSPDQKLKKTAD